MLNKFWGISCIVIGTVGLLVTFYNMYRDKSKKTDGSGTRNEKLKSEILSVLLPSQEIYDEIALLRCANPLSDKFRDKLSAIERLGNPEYIFSDSDIEKLKIDLINLCSEIRARFMGYDKNAAQNTLNRGDKELAFILADRDLENVKIINEFERVLREFVKRLNA